MKFAYFTHSLASCWNHGNAHFLRGVLRELKALGHDVQAFEPANAWSVENLIADHGEQALGAFSNHYPDLRPTIYRPDADVTALAAGADLVISDAQPHKGAIKREAEQNLGLKRSHWPTPKALAPAQSEGTERTSFVEAGYCSPSALHVSLHRPCAAPPTGPPSSR